MATIAEDLDLPASAVLGHCQRLGIDAGWAGALVEGPDLERLMEELAARAPDPAPTGSSPMALSSSPHLIESLAPPEGEVPHRPVGTTAPSPAEITPRPSRMCPRRYQNQ